MFKNTLHYLALKFRDGLTLFIFLLLFTGISIYAANIWKDIGADETKSGATVTQSLMDKIRGNLDYLNERINTVNSVPAGAVMAFNLGGCPSGWTAADGNNGAPDVRGAFVRGINGNLNGRDVVRTTGSYQTDATQRMTQSILVQA